MWVCNGCGFVFVYPLKGTVLDGTVDHPNTVETHHIYREELMLSARTRVRKLTEFLGDLDGLKVLDVGCGNGYFLEVAKDAGMQVTGIEINQAAARYAKKEYDIDVVVASPPYDRYLGGHTFDIITL